MAAESDASIAEVVDPESHRHDGSQIKVCGMITQVTRKVSKNSGRPYAIVTLEDLEAEIEVMFFGDTYEPVASLLATDLVISLTGRIRTSDDRPTSLMAMSMTIPDVTDPNDRPLNLIMPMEKATEDMATKLKRILESNKGQTDVHIILSQPGRQTVMRLDRSIRVDPNPSLYGDLKALLGSRCFSV